MRRLEPVVRIDDFHLVWRVGDPSPAVAAFVALAEELDHTAA